MIYLKYLWKKRTWNPLILSTVCYWNEFTLYHFSFHLRFDGFEFVRYIVFKSNSCVTDVIVSLFNWITSRNCNSLVQIKSFPNVLNVHQNKLIQWCRELTFSVTGQKKHHRKWIVLYVSVLDCRTSVVRLQFLQNVFEYFPLWKHERLLCAKQWLLHIHVEIYRQKKKVCIIRFWWWPSCVRDNFILKTFQQSKCLKSKLHFCDWQLTWNTILTALIQWPPSTYSKRFCKHCSLGLVSAKGAVNGRTEPVSGWNLSEQQEHSLGF